MNFYKLDHYVTNKDIDTFHFDNQKIGVIIHIEDREGNILLQKRGNNSRDERGLYEDVGGKVEKCDSNFKNAILREMSEEMGNDLNIELLNSTDIFHCFKNDIHWIFVIFRGIYINGDIKIMEPEKCSGYRFFSYDEIIDYDIVSESCKFLTKKIKKYY